MIIILVEDDLESAPAVLMEIVAKNGLIFWSLILLLCLST